MSASDYTITSGTYNNYFDDNGDFINTEVQSGDTLDLSGDFNGRNFTITKNLTVTSKNSNANLNDCTVIVKNSASGSSISNLHIYHTEWYGTGILLDGSSNNHIFNNRIECVEHGGITIALLANSDNNIIEGNVLNTTITSWDAFHETVVLFASDYNIIRNNLIYCGDDNGIYASIYGRSGGVKSNYNQIINNTVICQVDNPSAWNYGIQMMGDYNTIINNTVKGCYRAISTTSGVGNIVSKNIVDTVIGDMGIYSSTDDIVTDNILTGIKADCGIYAGENTIIENNIVEALDSTIGLSIGGSNVLIKNNTISSQSASTIYGIGKYSNITITENTLTSNTGVVVQLKKQSSKKYISDVEITNNIINSNSNIIVDAKEAQSPVIYSDNTYSGSGLVLLPENSNGSSNGSGFNGKVYNITPSNYDDFFDINGIIRPNSLTDGDIAYFIGEFDNKILSINKRLKITGDNPVFTNTTFRILESGCWIENITIINNNPDATKQWGLFISGANNVTVLNNKVSVSDKETAYAIYILDSYDSTIIGNTFKSSGEFLTYTVLAYEVSNLVFKGNIIDTNGTSSYYNYTSSICIDGVRDVPEIYRTYGLLGIYIGNSLISDNIVKGTSGLSSYNPLSTNSIVGIDLYYDSNDNVVSNNNVSIVSLDSYLYGLGVLGSEMGSHSSSSSNNKFLSNNVYINGTYFATGIIVGDDSYNTVISNNNISLDSYEFTYGLTFESSDESVAEGNIINAKGSANYLVELYASSNNNISGNVLSASGANSYGVAGYNSNDNLITANTINVYKISDDSPVILRHSDVISPGTNGVYFMEDSVGNTVSFNSIVTNVDYCVVLDNSSASVFSNKLESNNFTGDSAVNPLSSLVYNNTGLNSNSVNLTLNPLVKVYLSDDKLTGSIFDSAGKAIIGHHVSVTLVRPSSGASKSYDVVSDYLGVFKLDINLAPGTYNAFASYSGSSSYDPAVSSTVNIIVNREESNKTSTVLVTSDFNEPYGAGKDFTGSLLTGSGVPIIGYHLSVTLTRLSSGASKSYDVVCDYLGAFKLAINLAPGEYSVACSFDGTSVYESSSSYNKLTIF